MILYPNPTAQKIPCTKRRATRSRQYVFRRMKTCIYIYIYLANVDESTDNADGSVDNFEASADNTAATSPADERWQLERWLEAAADRPPPTNKDELCGCDPYHLHDPCRQIPSHNHTQPTLTNYNSHHNHSMNIDTIIPSTSAPTAATTASTASSPASTSASTASTSGFNESAVDNHDLCKPTTYTTECDKFSYTRHLFPVGSKNPVMTWCTLLTQRGPMEKQRLIPDWPGRHDPLKNEEAPRRTNEPDNNEDKNGPRKPTKYMEDVSNAYFHSDTSPSTETIHPGLGDLPKPEVNRKVVDNKYIDDEPEDSWDAEPSDIWNPRSGRKGSDANKHLSTRSEMIFIIMTKSTFFRRPLQLVSPSLNTPNSMKYLT